ncbi:hypothetical protein V1521DRAFT_273418 [Lipomyces starkeyi]
MQCGFDNFSINSCLASAEHHECGCLLFIAFVCYGFDFLVRVFYIYCPVQFGISLLWVYLCYLWPMSHISFVVIIAVLSFFAVCLGLPCLLANSIFFPKHTSFFQNNLHVHYIYRI